MAVGTVGSQPVSWPREIQALEQYYTNLILAFESTNSLLAAQKRL